MPTPQYFLLVAGADDKLVAAEDPPPIGLLCDMEELLMESRATAPEPVSGARRADRLSCIAKSVSSRDCVAAEMGAGLKRKGWVATRKKGVQGKAD